MFLVRSAFWLSVVILLLPAEKSEINPELADSQPKITAGKALVAAQSTVDDLSGFCSRNQTACDTGSAAIDIFIRKAQYGAGLLNEWVSGVSPANASTVKPVEHSSLLAPTGNKFIVAAKAKRSSQQTLTKEDLVPAWGGPRLKRKV